jgi:carbamoyltransferase
MLVLGLNMFHADASAAIVQDGKVLFAIAEERLNRVKHFGGLPTQAIRACLAAAGARLDEVDHVAVGHDPGANLSKKVQYAARNPSKLPNLLKMKQRRKSMGDLRTLLGNALDCDPARLRFRQHNVEHHLAHIASAFYCSPYDSCAGLSYDGSGDFVTVMQARCEGTQIHPLHRTYIPHSLGSFYTMICDFIGYRKYGDEGKVMGLAPYGTDACYEQVAKFVRPAGSGLRLDLKFFMPLGSNQGISIAPDGTMQQERHFSPAMERMFGQPREPHSEFTRRDMDLAFAMQRRFEEIFFHLLNKLHGKCPTEDVALAGGCALNSVANGKIFDATPFRRSWIQPAAGDEGLALGAALYVWHHLLKQPRQFVMTSSYLGPEFSEGEIRNTLDAAGLTYERLEFEPLVEVVAGEAAQGRVIGWFQGRTEWGPRALGNRSIIAHPGLPNMKETLNARVKHREWFRPFAPSILAERQSEYFEHSHPSPFMLHVFKIRPEKRAQLCAVNHVDNTGRLQSVARDENPLYYDLISAFERKTGIPVLLNTSYNENEPIVNTPAEAIDCFQRTRMDVLAMGNFLCRKNLEG